MPEMEEAAEDISEDSSEPNMNNIENVSVLPESLQVLDKMVLTDEEEWFVNSYEFMNLLWQARGLTKIKQPEIVSSEGTLKKQEPRNPKRKGDS